MVKNGEMNQQAAENLNKKSLVRFHTMLSKLLRESNINPQPENENSLCVKVEKVLGSILNVQNLLKVMIDSKKMKESIDAMNLDLLQINGLT